MVCMVVVTQQIIWRSYSKALPLFSLAPSQCCHIPLVAIWTLVVSLSQQCSWKPFCILSWLWMVQTTWIRDGEFTFCWVWKDATRGAQLPESQSPSRLDGKVSPRGLRSRWGVQHIQSLKMWHETDFDMPCVMLFWDFHKQSNPATAGKARGTWYTALWFS